MKHKYKNLIESLDPPMCKIKRQIHYNMDALLIISLSWIITAFIPMSTGCSNCLVSRSARHSIRILAELCQHRRIPCIPSSAVRQPFPSNHL